MDDGHNLLAGVERLGARRAVGLLTHLGGELPDDGQGDVGVDEGSTDVRNRMIDVRLGQDPAAAQGAEGLGQTI